jgi:hypothetical protein
MWFHKKKLFEEDPKGLSLEMLSLQQGAIMAKLLLVSTELQRRYQALASLSDGLPDMPEGAASLQAKAAELRGFNIILDQLLAKGLSKFKL